MQLTGQWWSIMIMINVMHYDKPNQNKQVAATDKNHKNCQNRVMGDCVITNNLTSFSILRIADVRHIRLSNVKNLTLRQMLGSKKVKSSCPCNLSTDFDEIWHGDAR